MELHGTVLPEGATLALLTGSAGRDERKYPDPDTYDIHRSIDRHVTFGYGAHFCLGAALARMEGTVALAEVLRRFPSWEVDRSAVTYVATNTVRGPSSVAGELLTASEPLDRGLVLLAVEIAGEHLPEQRLLRRGPRRASWKSATFAHRSLRTSARPCGLPTGTTIPAHSMRRGPSTGWER